MKIILSTIGVVLALFFVTAAAYSKDPMSPKPPRDIYLVGPVNDTSASFVKVQLDALNAVNDDQITLHITSLGGSVYAGLRIYDDMMESRSPIRTVCEGYCMSMAAILLAVGDTREASANTTIMFHEVSFGAEGKLTDVKAVTAEAERLQTLIDKAISERSGLSMSQVRMLERTDNYMSGREALELGLIDTVRQRRRD